MVEYDIVVGSAARKVGESEPHKGQENNKREEREGREGRFHGRNEGEFRA